MGGRGAEKTNRSEALEAVQLPLAHMRVAVRGVCWNRTRNSWESVASFVVVRQHQHPPTTMVLHVAVHHHVVNVVDATGRVGGAGGVEGMQVG